jgi:hypothetical protein
MAHRLGDPRHRARVPGRGLGGRELDLFGVRTSSTVPAVVLLLATAALGGGVAHRRGERRPAGDPRPDRQRASVSPPAPRSPAVGSYLVRWWWVIAAFVWLSVSWSIWSLLSRSRVRPRSRPWRWWGSSRWPD